MNPPGSVQCSMPHRTAEPAAPGLGSLEPGARAATIVAAQHAVAVDQQGRFPVEAFEVLREMQLLSAAVPREYGGSGASLGQVAEVCRMLGTACSSTAMIYAMHQTQAFCLIEHAPRDTWHAELFGRLVSGQLLLASATSEDTVGGNLRNSVCALTPIGGRFEISKQAPTISYGAYADAILVTTRRTAESSASDQVLVTLMKGDYALQRTSEWDALGMRGTCSDGFLLTGSGSLVQALPTSFSQIADNTMLPVSHTLWAAAWIGICADAVNRARAFLRKQARSRPGVASPGGIRLGDAVGMLRMMEARLDSVIAARARSLPGSIDTSSFGYTAEMNDLKIRMSTMALQIVSQVMMICGMAGYRNGTPFSAGRHLRDLHSAPIMISNDRLAASNAVLMLAERFV